MLNRLSRLYMKKHWFQSQGLLRWGCLVIHCSIGLVAQDDEPETSTPAMVVDLLTTTTEVRTT